MATIKIGLLGLGSVGSSLVEIFKRNKKLIASRAGFEIEIAHAAAAGLDKQNFGDYDFPITSDPKEVVDNSELSIIVELTGCVEQSREAINKAIKNKKAIVTSNRALIAQHGNEIFKLADIAGVHVAFEATVAGAIPIIKILREGMTANRLNSLACIINAPSHFILSEMAAKGCEFPDAMHLAQVSRLIEVSPEIDISGLDACYKLAIISALAFGVEIDCKNIDMAGIAAVTSSDISYANELGFCIKPIAVAKRTQRGLVRSVHPALIPKNSLLAGVKGIDNAILLSGDLVASTFFNGPGAGAEAIASAVLADIVDIVRDKGNQGLRLPTMGQSISTLQEITPCMDVVPFYLRFQVQDRAGMLAEITKVLATNNVSIEALLQKGLPQPSNRRPVVIMTHPVSVAIMNKVIEEIESLPGIVQKTVSLRVEDPLKPNLC